MGIVRDRDEMLLKENDGPIELTKGILNIESDGVYEEAWLH